jgi:hypothetical protein
MNPNNQNFTTSSRQIISNEQTILGNLSVQPRIETTQYNSNSRASIQGFNTNFQTVAFDQQPRQQTLVTVPEYYKVFRYIPEQEYYHIRSDLKEQISLINSFRRASFDVKYLTGKDFNFHTCQIHMEERANIVYKVVDGRTVFFDHLCDLCLDDDKIQSSGYKSEHFTSILKRKKEEIFSLDKENFEHELHADNIWQNLKSLILKSAIKAIDYSRSFKNDFFDLIGRNILTVGDIENLKKIIHSISENKSVLNFKGIGEHPELKQQYISLAIFLISYRKQNYSSLNFSDLEVLLKKYILEIYTVRQETINNYTEWLRQLISYYQSFCISGNLQVDNNFLSKININLFEETKIEYRESSEWKLKYNELLIQYNTEIKNFELNIINLRNNVNIQVQEVNKYNNKNKIII